MVNANVFNDATIDEDKHRKALQDETHMNKVNSMSKGVVSLENMYELKNHFRGPFNAKTHS